MNEGEGEGGGGGGVGGVGLWMRGCIVRRLIGLLISTSLRMLMALNGRK